MNNLIMITAAGQKWWLIYNKARVLQQRSRFSSTAETDLCCRSVAVLHQPRPTLIALHPTFVKHLPAALIKLLTKPLQPTPEPKTVQVNMLQQQSNLGSVRTNNAKIIVTNNIIVVLRTFTSKLFKKASSLQSQINFFVKKGNWTKYNQKQIKQK